MKDFRGLTVWRRSHDLTLQIYIATKSFPRDELFGLTSQLRRASSSIAANIAEGCGRDSDPDFKRFLQIAFGSANEVDYHLLLSRDLGLLSETEHSDMFEAIQEIKRMLASLIRKIRDDQ